MIKKKTNKKEIYLTWKMVSIKIFTENIIIFKENIKTLKTFYLRSKKGGRLVIQYFTRTVNHFNMSFMLSKKKCI